MLALGIVLTVLLVGVVVFLAVRSSKNSKNSPYVAKRTAVGPMSTEVLSYTSSTKV